ncbi:MAG: M28 family peptidase [Gemmatimonadetes bacterium]|nr:M28 family peptidase [Gemmatimonadota bacterium]
MTGTQILKIATLATTLTVAGCSGFQGADPQGSPQAQADIEAGRLREYLFDFAADSMMGRAAGTESHQRATRYLARRAAEFGLEPGGENGTYFQDVPLTVRAWQSTLEVEGEAIQIGQDFAPYWAEGLAGSTSGRFTDAPVVFGGDLGAVDGIDPLEVAGKVVVFGAVRAPDGRAFGLVPGTLERYAEAEAVLLAANDYAPGEVLSFLVEPSVTLDDDATEADASSGQSPLMVFVSEALVERLFGQGVDVLATGAEGRTVRGEISQLARPTEAPTRNVIAVIRGSDPALRDEYVVISAHSDHLAPQLPAVDHDSLRAYLTTVRPEGAESPERPATTEEQQLIEQRLANSPDLQPRLDSIRNGADDDGSGSVALLEIGRVLAAASTKPRRSVLLVWHTGEELGLFGSQHFTDHPTVPLESLVADINVDMIGRGGVDDVDLGGPTYLQLIGTRRLSTELGDLVETVNIDEAHGFSFDYQYDADGHPSNIYCRSDHYMYARYGIPIVFMSTGAHPDYHMRTDEPQYIDYNKLARVARFAKQLGVRVANRNDRLVVDKPVPSLDTPCQQ